MHNSALLCKSSNAIKYIADEAINTPATVENGIKKTALSDFHHFKAASRVSHRRGVQNSAVYLAAGAAGAAAAAASPAGTAGLAGSANLPPAALAM